MGRGTIRLSGLGVSNLGLRRSNNEDSFVVDEPAGLFLVADGMGGAASGELASRLVADTIAHYVRHYLDRPLEDADRFDFFEGGQTPRGNTLLQAIHMANSLVYDASHQDNEHKGMGSTVAVLLLDDDHVLAANVGDSRIFRQRGDRLERLTVDHRLLDDPKMKGVIDPTGTIVSTMGNTLTRAMGVRREVQPDIRRLAVEDGDLFLLCSDGLSDMVEEEMIARVLGMDRSLDQKAKDLIELALAGGGKDNVTVVLAAPQAAGRLKGLLNKITGG